MYNTEVLKIEDNLIKDNKISDIKNTVVIKKAADLIKKGEVVAFPTETVYGLGANALNSSAVEKIFKAKGRPSDNPLIAHISNKQQLSRLINTNIPEVVERLISKFWPGPLTIIFNKSKIVPDITTASLDTVAIRMPSHPVALALIEEVQSPLAAPSANSSGLPSPTKAEHVYNDLDGKIPLIVDGGICNIGVESTVIEIEDRQVNILRPGGITKEMIINRIGRDFKVISDNNNKVDNPKSPGMKYKHYSPQTPLWIIRKKSVKSIFADDRLSDQKTLFILTKETADKINLEEIDVDIENMGSINNLNYIAKHLFNLLRDVDKKGYQLILIEEVPDKDIGEAIMNRLKKAALKII
ncbi:MAG: L-threonylcarbamoyladenylate synthase [Bacillota bacterium]